MSSGGPRFSRMGADERSCGVAQMQSKRDLAKKFAEKWQLNVSERRSLQGQALSGSLLVEEIALILRHNGWYPRDWRPDDGFDGGLVELIGDDTCRIYWKIEIGVSRFDLQEVQNVNSLAAGCRAY